VLLGSEIAHQNIYQGQGCRQCGALLGSKAAAQMGC
jgi:ribosomal protein L40E